MKIELAPVLNLLRRAPAATLATQSLQMPGYPFATVVPNVLDEGHRPILLVSVLAEHTKNLLADPRISLSVSESLDDQVQEGQRLTLVGDAEPFEPDSALQARYLRYVPAAEQYLALDFRFFRIHPKRVRYIGGVGRMGWIEADDFATAATLAPETEAGLLAEAQALAPAHVRLLGIDAYGIDYSTNGIRDRATVDAGNLGETVRARVPQLGAKQQDFPTERG